MCKLFGTLHGISFTLPCSAQDRHMRRERWCRMFCLESKDVTLQPVGQFSCSHVCMIPISMQLLPLHVRVCVHADGISTNFYFRLAPFGMAHIEYGARVGICIRGKLCLHCHRGIATHAKHSHLSERGFWPRGRCSEFFSDHQASVITAFLLYQLGSGQLLFAINICTFPYS